MLSTNSPTVMFWAVVRVLLGTAQMAGAIVSLVLLMGMGLIRETMVSLFATLVMMVLSIFLFKVLKVDHRV